MSALEALSDISRPPATPVAAPRIRCRHITDPDLEGVVNLLTRGFPYSRESWVSAFKRLAEHPTPAGYPKYGYLLQSGGVPVGVMPMIFSAFAVDGETRIRCSVSNWYVEPAFRSYAALLAWHAQKHKNVTYFVITPVPHTRAILEAQGYERYCRGRFVAVPALSAAVRGAHVAPIAPGASPGEDLPAHEIELLRAHANLDCISVICKDGDRRYPFVFATRRKFGLVPVAVLVYCRDMRDFVRFAGNLGRFLVRRGFPLLVLDADGPMPGLVGQYSDHYPKYFKGPNPPRIGDMAYSKRVFFGI
jgi:hypothetical protein